MRCFPGCVPSGLSAELGVALWRSRQRCMVEPREARDARDVTGEQFAACARYAGTWRRQPARFPEPSGWRRRRCEQDRFTAPGGRRPRAPGRVNSCPQDLTGVAGTAMRQPLAPVNRLCSRPAHIAVPAGRRPAVAAPYGMCGEITYSYRRPGRSDASVIGLSGTESGPRGRDHGTPGGHRGRRRIAHFVYTCRKPNATPMT